MHTFIIWCAWWGIACSFIFMSNFYIYKAVGVGSLQVLARLLYGILNFHNSICLGVNLSFIAAN